MHGTFNLKLTFIFLVFSSVISIAAAQAAVQCTSVDKAGSPLVGQGVNNGDGTVTCTYQTARACTYFAANGENESGSSNCPAGIPQTVSGSSSSSSAIAASSSSTSLAVLSTSSVAATSISSTSSSVAHTTTASSSSVSSATSISSTTTVAVTSTTTTPSSGSSTSGFTTITTSVSQPAANAPSGTTSSSAPTKSNSAVSVFAQGSVSSVVGIMMVVAAVYMA